MNFAQWEVDYLRARGIDISLESLDNVDEQVETEMAEYGRGYREASKRWDTEYARGHNAALRECYREWIVFSALCVCLFGGLWDYGRSAGIDSGAAVWFFGWLAMIAGLFLVYCVIRLRRSKSKP
jgi:hypothetical protein